MGGAAGSGLAAFCTHCGTQLQPNALFCSKCGATFSGGSQQAGAPKTGQISLIVNDIEFGSVERKLDAIGKLHSLVGVDLPSVQQALEKVLAGAPSGSMLKFYAASTLAALGDNRDLVAEALVPFMSGKPFDGPGDTLIHFPWATDEPKYLSVWYERQFSPQIGTIEAFGQMRDNGRAAQALTGVLERVSRANWRLFTIYAAGANGHQSLRKQLEYLRDREPGSAEASAASIALEHFGTSSILEIAQLHSRHTTKEHPTKKSGCFIATAVYGVPGAPEIEILREFRDQVLLHTRVGHAFVAAYYRVSPPVARLISRSGPLRFTFRKVVVEPIV